MRKVFLFLIATAFLAGCMAPKVRVTKDEFANFGTLKTYRWTKSALEVQTDFPRIHEHIRRQVDQHIVPVLRRFTMAQQHGRVG